QTIIQLVDNKTSSLVGSPEIYVDAVRIFPINNSENSFPLIMEVGKNYEIRGVSSGYSDLIQTINITSQPIEFSISPEKEKYFFGETITLSSSLTNVTYLFDNEIIVSPFSINKIGDITIKVVKEGSMTSSKIITIENAITYTSCSEDFDKWRKGKKITCGLNENVSWSVTLEEYYKEKDYEGYREPITISSGEGNYVDFSIDKEGWYKIKTGEYSIISQNVTRGGLLKKVWDWLGYWWIALGGVIILVLFLILKKPKGEGSGIVFAPQQAQGD
ncbi:MAG: hypothetical protein KKB31_05725, partial [Nanoarchaeota archaeon]|nr:hypothetical protein [Nanoarchaeota archaeon]